MDEGKYIVPHAFSLHKYTQNMCTHIGEAFLARELVVPGLEPVKAPPQTTATGITKVGIEKFLPTPMAQLSLAADGTLAIPTEKELEDNPPVSMTPELLSFFGKLRAELTQSTPHTSQGVVDSGPRKGTIRSLVAGEYPWAFCVAWADLIKSASGGT